MARFGEGDASYQAAGQSAGIRRLVDAFYRHMSSLPEAKKVREMHEDDLSLSREKLTVFLSGWLGGPKEYSTRFGKIRIPHAHEHLEIDEAERDAWMRCMELAVAEQDTWSDEFKSYFLSAIAVPAERVRRASVARREE